MLREDISWTVIVEKDVVLGLCWRRDEADVRRLGHTGVWGLGVGSSVNLRDERCNTFSTRQTTKPYFTGATKE